MFFIIILWGNPSFALKCKGGTLVNVGDLKYEVLQRCGAPAYKEVVGEKVAYKFRRRYGKSESVVIEAWVYTKDQLPGSWGYQLTFGGTKLIEIKHLSP